MVLFLQAGIILGPSVLGRNKAYRERIEHPATMLLTSLLSIVGVLYFVFLTAIKMDKSRILTMAKKFRNLGLQCFIYPMIILSVLFFLFHNHMNGIKGQGFRLYISSRLSLSYFPVIANALSELNLLTTELGEIALSSSILHEIIEWFILAISLVMRGNLREMVQAVGSLSVVFLFIIFIVRPIIIWVIEKTPEGKPVNGFYLKAILGAPMLVAVISDMFGVTIFPGALLMGLIIPSGPPLGSSIIDRAELFAFEIILPFMYIRAGMLMNLCAITDWKVFVLIQVAMFLAHFGKIIGCVLAMPKSSAGLRNSLLLGFMLNTKGVVEISLLMRWRTRMVRYITIQVSLEILDKLEEEEIFNSGGLLLMIPSGQ